MYRERKTWSSRKFGERIFFGGDDVFQMKEFRTTLIYIDILCMYFVDYMYFWKYTYYIDSLMYYIKLQEID